MFRNEPSLSRRRLLERALVAGAGGVALGCSAAGGADAGAAGGGHGSAHAAATTAATRGAAARRNRVYEAAAAREPATAIAYEPRHVHLFAGPGGGGGLPEAVAGRAEMVAAATKGLRGGRDWNRNLSRFVIESLCGEDDSQDVELYDGKLGVPRPFVDQHQPRVGQLQWNDDLQQKYTRPGNVQSVRWCSGMLITENLYLCAGHCFDEEQPFTGWSYPKRNDTGGKIAPPEIATNMHVNFNYQFDPQGALRPEDRYRVSELLEYRLGNLDYAIVRLEGEPGRKWGIGKVSKDDAKQNDLICIIGHPAGVPKRVEAGHATDFRDTRIGYNDLDTLGGNSGSAIIHLDSGAIVGVHTNGGCDDPAVGHNYGHRITSLLAVSKTLQGLV